MPLWALVLSNGIAFLSLGLLMLTQFRSARHDRATQHEEGQRRLGDIELDIREINTSIRPIVRWWNGGPAARDDR